MNLLSALLVLLLSLMGCATGAKFSAVSPMGLSSFPLDSSTKETVMQENGPPKNIMTLPSGNEGWIYEFGENYGKKTYTVEFTKEGKVVDVMYNDRGPYNGLTAKKIQQKR